MLLDQRIAYNVTHSVCSKCPRLAGAQRSESYIHSQNFFIALSKPFFFPFSQLLVSKVGSLLAGRLLWGLCYWTPFWFVTNFQAFPNFVYGYISCLLVKNI